MLLSLTPDPRLLAIEDDPTLGAYLFRRLNSSDFEITWCRSGEEGLAVAHSGAYDLILIDIILPGRDGLRILRQPRQEQALPVILTSALDTEQGHITGFGQGADNYLPKPFSLTELRVRIDAILRRIALERGDALGHCVGPLARPSLQFSANVCDASPDKRFASLAPTEYRLLETFPAAEDEALTKTFLYQHVLHHGHTQHDRSLDIHVSHL